MDPDPQWGDLLDLSWTNQIHDYVNEEKDED